MYTLFVKQKTNTMRNDSKKKETDLRLTLTKALKEQGPHRVSKHCI